MFKIFEIAENGNITELAMGSTTTAKSAAHIQTDTDACVVMIIESENGGFNDVQATAIKAKAKSLLKDGVTDSATKRGKAELVKTFEGENGGVKYIAAQYPAKGFNSKDAAQAQAVKDAFGKFDAWLQANTVAAPVQPVQPAQPQGTTQPQGNQQPPVQPAQPQGNQPPAQPAQPQGTTQPQGNQPPAQPAQPTRTASHYSPWWEGIDPNDADAMAAAARQFLNS